MSMKQVLPWPTLAEPVLLTIDGSTFFPLTYNLRTMKRLKARFGHALVGLNKKGAVGINGMDEEAIALIIWEGLHDATGAPPEGITIDDLEKLPASAYPYLLERFSTAYQQAMPAPAPAEKKSDEQTETATQ